MINLGTARHVARKVHRCESCGARINPGEPYNRARIVDGGDAWVWKAHTACDAASLILWRLGVQGDDGEFLAVRDMEDEDIGMIMVRDPEIWQAIWGGARDARQTR